MGKHVRPEPLKDPMIIGTPGTGTKYAIVTIVLAISCLCSGILWFIGSDIIYFFTGIRIY
jgi:hypothetical protein